MTLHYLKWNHKRESKNISNLQNAASPPGKGKSGSLNPAAAAASMEGPEVMWCKAEGGKYGKFWPAWVAAVINLLDSIDEVRGNEGKGRIGGDFSLSLGASVGPWSLRSLAVESFFSRLSSLLVEVSNDLASFRSNDPYSFSKNSRCLEGGLGVDVLIVSMVDLQLAFTWWWWSWFDVSCVVTWWEPSQRRDGAQSTVALKASRSSSCVYPFAKAQNVPMSLSFFHSFLIHEYVYGITFYDSGTKHDFGIWKKKVYKNPYCLRKQ